jgi:GNAT superfamily N-acetyltransferase
MESQDFAIRAGRREDAEAAARLWMQSAQEHTSHDPVYATAPDAEKTMRRFLADLARNGYAFVFVATVDEEMVGFASGELREGSPTFLPKTWASVDDVFVLPGYRNRGIGHALIASVEGWARRKGANGVSLQVAAANGRGRKFYKDLGFREISVYEVLEF